MRRSYVPDLGNCFRPPVTTSWAQVGRGLAVVVPAVGAALGLLWRYGRRPAPVPAVVRCPIHGVAYDSELEMCPSCAKTETAARQDQPRPEMRFGSKGQEPRDDRNADTV
jgi:hypothetical protein